METAKILIAEDEMLIASSMASKLEGMGYRVTAIAGSGKKAIDEVGKTEPDLVLMDIKLQGGMDGVTAAESIRTRFGIPVIYLTAFSDNETISRAKLTEPFGYLFKPFEDNMLHASIQMALYKHKMEKRLKESELRYRSIVENSYDGIMLLNEEGSVVEWNSGEEQITGWKRDKAIGRPFWEIQNSLAPKPIRQRKGTLQNLRKSISDALRNGKSDALDREQEYEIERTDHALRYVQTSMFPIKTDRGFMLGGISRDVTEHRLAEEAVRESREEMRLLAAHLQSVREEERSLVAREIHDELGQSLTAIKMDLSFMQRKLPAGNQALLGKIQGTIEPVMLDISMPGPSGLEILKQIRCSHPRLPVPVLSMHSEDQYAVRVLRAGASGYLTKETASEELIRAVRKTASGRKYVSQTLAEKLADDLQTPSEQPPHKNLSDREFQVFSMIASGKAVHSIAEEMHLSVKTISTYRMRILEKMGLKNNAELMHYAMTEKLVE